jgi:hypothetical protein
MTDFDCQGRFFIPVASFGLVLLELIPVESKREQTRLQPLLTHAQARVMQKLPHELIIN